MRTSPQSSSLRRFPVEIVIPIVFFRETLSTKSTATDAKKTKWCPHANTTRCVPVALPPKDEAQVARYVRRESTRATQESLTTTYAKHVPPSSPFVGVFWWAVSMHTFDFRRRHCLYFCSSGVIFVRLPLHKKILSHASHLVL